MSSPGEHPNPIVHASESSALPRQARARVGQTTDPLPEGKEVAEPVHHFTINPAGHDVERTQPKTAEELNVPRQELEKLQGGDRGRVPLYSDQQKGVDWQGSGTQANKNMDSRHRHGGELGPKTHK